MPPKRKAATHTAENEPPQTRRRTRAAAAAGIGAQEAPVSELPATKRPRRTAKTKEEAPAAEDFSKAQKPASKSTDIPTRATRTTTRSRKAATNAEEVKQAGPSEPKRRGRTAKVQLAEPEPAVPEEHPAPRQPLSPIPEKSTQTIPKKRGRPKKTEEAPNAREPEPAAAEEGVRRTRARRTKPPSEVTVAQESTVKANPLKTAAAQRPPTPEIELPKRRGRAKKPPSPARRPVTPPPLEQDESSDDELLFTPSKKTPARPTTPMPTGGTRMGTPRVVMHSVEIATPKRLLNTVRRDLGSPGPRVHVPPLGTLRLPSAFPSASPQKRGVSSPAAGPPADRTPSPLPHAARKMASPSKQSRSRAQNSNEELPKALPPHLHPLLERQKRTILKSLQQPPEVDEIDVYGEDYPPTNTLAYEQLGDLLTGTVTRGEGNSCLLIGPSGSGKTQMVEKAIAALPDKPIVVRLSGYAQHNDRLAIREMAWQLAQQTGQSFLPTNDEGEDDELPDVPPDLSLVASAAVPPDREGEDDNPFVDSGAAPEPGLAISVTLPPPAHLLALISMIPTLPRPTVIVLDGFDLFASHARQALLYCLLDTAQACRAGPATAAGSGASSASGMAVVGVTARVDTINLLEKRVKSRFSGRMLRTAGPTRMGHWVALTKAVIGTPLDSDADVDASEEWGNIWTKAVERFMGDEAALEVLGETYALTRDYQMLRRILTCLALELTPSSPYPTAAKLEQAIARQRCPPRFPPLHTLPYPAICLLIAAVHAQTSGHDVFTFEMLHETFKNQVRTSQSAPVQVGGGGIGMVRCSREVLFAAFERLTDLRIFSSAAAPGATFGREFMLYRSAVDRFAVKKAVETIGHLNLKKWFTKAQ